MAASPTPPKPRGCWPRFWSWLRRRPARAADAAPAGAVHAVRLEPSGRVLRVAAGQSVLEAALAAGLPFPHQCKAAMCRSCRCTLQAGRIASRKPQHPPLSLDEQAQGLILACQTEPRSDLVIAVEARGNRPIPPAP